MPRMIQVIRKLKIGLENASEYLNAEFGINITSINDSITDEQYEYLANYLANEEDIIPEEKSSNRVIGMNEIRNRRANLKRGNRKTSKKSTIYDKMFGYIRIISVPFGGKKKW